MNKGLVYNLASITKGNDFGFKKGNNMSQNLNKSYHIGLIKKAKNQNNELKMKDKQENGQ